MKQQQILMRNPQRLLTTIITILITALTIPVCASGVSTLTELVKSWTDIKKITADEQRSWEQYKKLAEEHINALNSEIIASEHTLQQLEQKKTQLEDENNQLREIRKNSLETTATTEKLLNKYENELRRLYSILPDVFIRISHLQQPPVTTTGNVAERMDNLCRQYTELLTAQTAIHTGKSILSTIPDTERMEYDVICLGSAAMFCCNNTAKTAALAVFDRISGTWHWQRCDEQINDINTALQALQGSSSNQQVYLPFILQSGEQQ